MVYTWKWKWSRSVVSDSLRPHGLFPTRLLHPWGFAGKSTGVGCHFLLQGSTSLQLWNVCPVPWRCPLLCAFRLILTAFGITHLSVWWGVVCLFLGFFSVSIFFSSSVSRHRSLTHFLLIVFFCFPMRFATPSAWFGIHPSQKFHSIRGE